MKFIILFFCIFLEAKQTVCLNMIVKNESAIIEKNLQSVKGLIDYWVIVDTGSNDGTQEIVKRALKDVPGELHERKWVDFAHNRNEALALAKGDYVLFMDADEEFVGKKWDELKCDGYYLRFKKPDGLVEFNRLWMVKNDSKWKWVGVLHESLEREGKYTVSMLDGLSVLLSGDVGYRSKDPAKYRKDAAVLEKALKTEPDNARYAFYLAQSYLNAGEMENALKWYEKRAKMGGFEEEVFISLFAIGKIKNDPEAYRQAYQYRPSRVEPLRDLANYYIKKKNYLSGYKAAKEGAGKEISNDALFVESWIYEWGLLHIQAFCAFQLGFKDEAVQLYSELLKKKSIPEGIRKELEKNLESVKDFR